MSTIAPRTRLSLHFPSFRPPEVGGPRWTVNGWAASVVTWTAEEWARLRRSERPSDAQVCPNGVRCALRMA